LRDRALARFEDLFGPEFGHGKPLDLAHLRAALKALGNPQDKLPPIIHVAGTNGKGSAIAFMRAIAEAAGLRVHAFTKPHLFRLNERFVAAGNIADDDALIAAAERIAQAAPQLTQFDAHVAAAFLLFHETPADLVLLETGMGGREDSTNVIEHPALSVITPIGLDHQDALGATLSDIAAHKAGILKPGVAAIVARQPNHARAVIEARADALGAPLLGQGVEWDAFASHGRLVVQTQTRALDLPLPSLAGAHQIDNAGLAAAALLHWRPALSDDVFAAGIANAVWPARLQPLTRGPFSAPIRALGGEVWVDAGHNGHAAEALARAMEALDRRRKLPLIAIVGLRARKHAPAFVAPLARITRCIIAVPLSEDHALTERIASFAAESGALQATAISLADAMEKAAKTRAPRVLICGSFLLAADALAREGAGAAES
jgi:dihydrofolate synthase/folylpolyglutamate synthase